jgi:hypothetical protein
VKQQTEEAVHEVYSSSGAARFLESKGKSYHGNLYYAGSESLVSLRRIFCSSSPEQKGARQETRFIS